MQPFLVPRTLTGYTRRSSWHILRLPTLTQACKASLLDSAWTISFLATSEHMWAHPPGGQGCP